MMTTHAYSSCNVNNQIPVDNLYYMNSILIQATETKSSTTARKSILKLVTRQNVVKYGKYGLAKSANFVRICAYVFAPLSNEMW